MKAYPDNVAKYSELYNKTNKKYNSISLLRLLSIFLLLFFMFYYIKTNEILYVIFAVLSFAGFVFLMKYKEFKITKILLNYLRKCKLKKKFLAF